MKTLKIACCLCLLSFFAIPTIASTNDTLLPSGTKLAVVYRVNDYFSHGSSFRHNPVRSCGTQYFHRYNTRTGEVRAMKQYQCHQVLD